MSVWLDRQTPEVQRLLGELQAGLEFVPRPYRELAERSGWDEEGVLAELRRLRGEGLLREITALFDAAALGYSSALIAMETDDAEAAAREINSHPGVSHNYERRHSLNLWFTLLVPPGGSLEAHLAVLCRSAGARRALLLPALRRYKIAVRLRGRAEEATAGTSFAVRSGGGGKPDPADQPEPRKLTPSPPSPAPLPDAADLRRLRVMQAELDLEAEPFERKAYEAGESVAGLLEWCRAWRRLGRLRRLAGLLQHRRAGFTANGLGVWRVAEDRVEAAGLSFAADPRVSHCYRRPCRPDWPYALYTMFHGREEAEGASWAAEAARRLGLREYELLFSTREFKKSRPRLFTDESEVWERAHGIAVPHRLAGA